jgi:hypothetical protein
MSSLPGTDFVANPSLVINTASPSLAFDVKTLAAGGTVTVNGSAPISSSSSGYATITFTEPTLGYVTTLYANCSAPVGSPCPLSFSGFLYPGTYKVTVHGTYMSSLPGADYIVQPSLAVAAPSPNLAFDVKTHSIAGSVTVNGRAPTSSSSSGYATIDFTETTSGASISAYANCSAPVGSPCPLSFSGTVHPGVYKVEIHGTYMSSLPGVPYTAVDRIKL